RDWSSDVCSSDLRFLKRRQLRHEPVVLGVGDGRLIKYVISMIMAVDFTAQGFYTLRHTSHGPFTHENSLAVRSSPAGKPALANCTYRSCNCVSIACSTPSATGRP